MGNRKRLIAVVTAAALTATAMTTLADDTGLIVEAEVSHKITKTVSAAVDAELRTRNDFRTIDRVSIGADVSYKPLHWLKLTAGYVLLVDHQQEKLTYHDDSDEYNNWRPSYYGTRHRVSVSATGEYKPHKRVKISLRERYQFTHRGAHDTRRYDFDNQWWETVTVSVKNKHLLRSRLMVEWDIPRCKVDPFVSAELFNGMALQKARFIIGAEYTVKKRHTFSAYYRYQVITDEEDEEPNCHKFGLGYKFKF